MENIIWQGRFLLWAVMVAVMILPGAAAAQEDTEPSTSESEEPTVEPQPADEDAVPEAAPDEVIVKFDEDVSEPAKEDARSAEGVEKKEDLDLVDAEVVQTEEEQTVEETISALEARPEVEYAEPNFVVYPTNYKGEERFGDLWGLDNTEDVDVNAPEAFDVAQGGDEDLVVAVIDDGVDLSHPDLVDRAWKNPGETPNNNVDDDGNGKVDDVNGWDFVNDDNTVHDEHRDYHGTHVSGTIAASLNGQGVVGVGPNVKIMALKFIGSRAANPRSGGLTTDAIKAIEYAADPNKDGDTSDGAKISNNSWGGGGRSEALKEAITTSNSLFVAAAGNSNMDIDKKDDQGKLTQPHYPASYDIPNILSVSAIDNTGKLASFSNYGRESVDISAPGVSTLSTTPAIQDTSAVTLSSVGSGKALVAGFGVEEINGDTNRKRFMEEAFKAVGGAGERVVLVDDDGRPTDTTTCLNPAPPNVDSTISTAIKDATGTAPTRVEISCGNATAAYQNLQRNTTVVWVTGKSPYTFVDPTTGNPTRNLTQTDRERLLTFLKDRGGKLILTGMDTFNRPPLNDSFVTEELGLKVEPDIAGLSSTKFAGASYALNSSFADAQLHDVITPADSTATKGTYPGRSKWEFLNGTSMATPHATGVAALAASENLNEEDNSALLNNPVALKQAVLDGGRSIPATDGKATASGKMVDANLALTKADKIPPEISDMPSDITKTATSKDGATVTYSSPTATDKVDGPVNVTCASSPTPDLKSGDTFPLGTTEIRCTAKDKTGNKATKKFNVKVVYDYKGFFSPVDNPEVLNKARAGSAIPVKFTLGGDMGLDVFYSEKKDDGTTVSYPRSTIMNCSSADSVDAVEQTLTAGSSSLDYDQVTQQYTYVWKTSKEWAGSCRQLVVKLKDGTEHRAFFQLV